MTAQLADDLRALAEAGRVRRAWLPGMLGTVGRVVDGDKVLLPARCTSGTVAVPLTACIMEPVLTDPATVGCLLALLREAERDPLAHVRPPERGDMLSGLDMASNWFVLLPGEGAWATDLGASTEGEAIAAAIHAIRVSL